MNLEKIKLIREYETPKINKGVRAFLRLVNHYKAFINKFIATVTPFTTLTGKYPFF